MTDQPAISASVTPPPPAAPTGTYLPPPPAPVAAAAGPTEKPVYKRVWFWLVIFFVVLPILLTILGAIGLFAFSTSTESISGGTVLHNVGADLPGQYLTVGDALIKME